MESKTVIRYMQEAGMIGSDLGDALEIIGKAMDLVIADACESCAQIAEEYGPNRPIAARQPSPIVIGRWEGEQAASANIAASIRSSAKPGTLYWVGIDYGDDA